jgi:hypothetical protein
MPKTTLSELIISARLSNEKGNFDETRALCAQIFAQDTGNVAGLSSYMTATKIRPNDPVFARIEGFAKQTELPSDLLSQLHFMRGKGYGDMDKTDLAFEALIKANALKDVRFDPVALRRSAQRLIKAAKTAPTLRLPVATPRMVFIIGMPRSGTSLLAQALGAHSDVQNLGEQTALGAAMLDPVSERVSPLALLTSLTEERLIEVRDAYLSAIAPLRGAAPILIDKMPENYWLAFVIPMIFPDALIIHITRDRIATAWSCFRHDFKDGHAYSYDFAHCLAQYDLCKELTGAWKKTARGQWHSLALSRLCRDPKREVSAILSKLGLDWQDACMRPQDQENTVATLSKWQVRQGIDPNIAKGWEAYKPLITAKWGDIIG